MYLTLHLTLHLSEVHIFMHLTFICSIFYPQTFNLFELLWRIEGLNPKPIELNINYYVKTNVPHFCAPLGYKFCCDPLYIVKVPTFVSHVSTL